MFKTLLVPLDGSALAEQSLGQAAAIARATGAAIEVVTVHQPRAHDGYGDPPRDERLWNDEDRYLETVALELAAGGSVRVSHAILSGDPEEMIARRAANIEADLIVITSHGRTGFSRTWFGSVADGLVRRGPAPVLILRPIDGDARRTAAHTPVQPRAHSTRWIRSGNRNSPVGDRTRAMQQRPNHGTRGSSAHSVVSVRPGESRSLFNPAPRRLGHETAASRTRARI